MCVGGGGGGITQRGKQEGLIDHRVVNCNYEYKVPCFLLFLFLFPKFWIGRPLRQGEPTPLQKLPTGELWRTTHTYTHHVIPQCCSSALARPLRLEP